MQTSDIISSASLLVSVVSFGVSLWLGIRDRKLQKKLAELEKTNNLRQEFFQRWFGSSIEAYLGKYETCVTNLAAAMSNEDNVVRTQQLKNVQDLEFLPLCEDMSAFCDHRGDAVIKVIKEKLDTFIDDFLFYNAALDPNLSAVEIERKRPELFDIWHRFQSAVVAAMLTELSVIKSG